LRIVIACDKRDAFGQGSSSDEAIHSSLRGDMDCFGLRSLSYGGQVASLAMTELDTRFHPRGAKRPSYG
jgi:hypothetical protein